LDLAKLFGVAWGGYCSSKKKANGAEATMKTRVNTWPPLHVVFLTVDG